MIRLQRDGVVYYRFETLAGACLVQGIFTRLGGVSQGPFASLNVGHTVGDDPAHVEANLELIYRALGVKAQKVTTARQVHGDRVEMVTTMDGGRTFPETDALITGVPGLVLLLRFADCVPVLFYAPRQRAVGLAHAGWQGTVKKIAQKTALEMMRAYGCAPNELLVGLGPAIGPCCFEAGPEVVEALRATHPRAEELLSRVQPDGKAHVDLVQANVQQLAEVGVDRVELAEMCTSCLRHEFYSHRAEGGRTGRFAVAIGVRG
jgi:YfiH family protein